MDSTKFPSPAPSGEIHALLTVDQVTVAYGHVTACEGVSLSVDAGRCLGVVGPNGAGKTSLLGAIAGLHSAGGGSVTLDNNDLSSMPPHSRARSGLALVPEGGHLFPQLTVAQTLRLPRPYARSGHWDETSVYELFPRLADRRSSLAGNLSGGERQMLAIGRGLMLNPRVVMLDEPSSGLAPAVIGEVITAIALMLRQGLAVVLVEQSIRAARELSDEVLVMADGQVVQRGGAEILADDEGLRRSYLGT